MFTTGQFDIVKFCADEVARQHDKPLAVYWMLTAWAQAWDDSSAIEPSDLYPEIIRDWGQLVHPEKNSGGFRRVDLTLGASCSVKRIGVPWEEVPRKMGDLCLAINEGRLVPAEAYKEFEEIHPFRDGNGRVGVILYNYLLKTLDSPRTPPNYWREDRV